MQWTSHHDENRGRKLVLTALVASAAVAVATQGSDATFTATVSRGHSITTGNPMLVLGATGAATNRLGIDVVGLVPGASAYRSFDITNIGTDDFTSYTLSTSATTSSLLNTDSVNGLQVKLERCQAPWTETGTSPALSYTCSSAGGATTVLSSTPITLSNAAVSGMHSATAGGIDHLLLTETLPTSATNAFQNLTSAVTFTFTAA